MAGKNGREPKAPTIEVAGETYEARDISNMSYAEQLKGEALSLKLQEMFDNLRAYADMDFDLDDDDDDDEPPEELVEEYRLTHLRIVRFGFPGLPKSVLREMDEGQVGKHANTFVQYMMHQRRGTEAPDPTVQGRGSKKRSGNKSRGSRTATQA